jgi:alkylhydroperoxidase family enzyme
VTVEADSVREPIVAAEESARLRERWRDVQARFVDEPQRAVEDADALVAEAMQRVQQHFARTRVRLDEQWRGGGEASTEDLRLALTAYRSFFNRLLSS